MPRSQFPLASLWVPGPRSGPGPVIALPFIFVGGFAVAAVTGYMAGLLHENMFAEGWLLPLTVLLAPFEISRP